MVGVIVIGVIAGIIAATVFAVIPWSQNAAAKQSLDAVGTAEPAVLTLNGSYLSYDSLPASTYHLLEGDPGIQRPTERMIVDTEPAGWVSGVRSKTGAIYLRTSAGPEVFTAVDEGYLLAAAAGSYAGGVQTFTLPAAIDTSLPAGFTHARVQKLVDALTGRMAWGTPAIPYEFPAGALGGPVVTPKTFVNMTWKAQSALPTNAYWYSVDASADGKKIWAIGTYTTYKTLDGGATWSAVAALDSKSLAVSGDGGVVAAVDMYAGKSSSNGGSTWSTFTGGNPDGNIVMSADGKKIVYSQSSAPRQSTDYGLTWNSLPFGVSYGLLTMSADGSTLVSKPADRYGYSDMPGVISVDGGLTTARSVAGCLGAIVMSANGSTMVADCNQASANPAQGHVQISKDFGATWVSGPLLGAGIYAVSADGTKMVFAPTSAGMLSTSVDGGVTWTQQPDAGSGVWKSITMSDDGSRIIAGRFGGSLFVGDFN